MNKIPCLSGEDVESIVAAASAEAKANNWNPTVVVLDHTGEIVYVKREPGKMPGTVASGIAKAKCVAGFGAPTRFWAERVAEHPALQTLPTVLPLPGGVPIIYEGVTIGAIAVSGLTPDQDEQVAQAGANSVLVD